MYMTQGNLIQLKIDRSLSYTIDKKLDTELGQDVKLNYNQWQSVFNIVKSDDATAKKQYRGKGENINNGKDFVVDQNQVYSFTQKAWNAILEIARGSIKQEEKIETPQEENVQTPTSDKEVKVGTEKEVYEYEDTVLDILKKANIDTSDIEVNDVIQKYKNIVEYNKANNIEVDEARLTERIENYAKGLKFAKVEAGFDSVIKDAYNQSEFTEEEIAQILQTEGQEGLTQRYKEKTEKTWENYDKNFKNQEITDAINSGNMTNYKNALYQFAKEQIETYDDLKGDGKISFDEFLAKEEEKIGAKLDEEEKAGAKKIFEFLDKNQSGYIDKEEFAAYLLSMAKITDGNEKKTADDITLKEYMITNNALSEIGMNQESNDSKFLKKLFDVNYNGLTSIK